MLSKFLNSNSYYLFIAILLLGCTKQDYPPPMQTGRQVLVYMIADNNLDYFAVSDINEMEHGMLNLGGITGELLIYIDRGNNGSPAHPYLMRIIPDSSQQVVSEIIKVYPEQNSADPAVLSKVIIDVDNITDVPFESRGLIMWSHGNSWLPPEVSLYSDRDKILDTTSVNNRLKSFGLDEDISNSDYYEEMDVIEMANVLSPYKFDFILFDACFMGAIEVIYELKDVCDYIISSPTEILSAGFPYEDIIPDLLSSNFNASFVAEKKHEFYSEQKGILRSSAISVVDTENLSLLASFFKDIFLVSVGSIDISEKDVKFNVDSLQQFDRLYAEFLFDMYDFTMRVCDNNDLADLKREFNTIWQKSVVMSAHTPYMFGTLSLENCNGLSMYLPQQYESRKDINEYYKKYKWYKESGLCNAINCD